MAFAKERFNMALLDTGYVFGWVLTTILLIYLSVPLSVAASSLPAYSENNLQVWRVNATAPSQMVSWNYNPQDPSNTTGLVSRWKFNEESGQIAYDASRFGNEGILGNDTVTRDDDPLRMDGKFGNALHFDGKNDYVKSSRGFGMAFPALTVEFWLKAPRPNDWSTIIDRAPDWSVGSWKVIINPALHALRFETYDLNPGNYAGSIIVDDGSWHHVVVAVNASYVSFYVDGALDVAIRINEGSIQSSGSPDIFLGTRPGLYQWFNGLIDEVRIYNRALTSEEIWENYLRLGGILETGYSHYWYEPDGNITFRWDFNINETVSTNSSGMTIICTFPIGHEILNVTYPIDGNWSYILPSYSYKVSSYNSTHQNLIILESDENQYGGSYRLYTTASNDVSDIKLEVNQLSQANNYFAPIKKVHVAIRTKDPHENPINTSTSALLFNEEGRLMNKTEGTSSSGWFNYSIIMPSKVGKYWFMTNSSGNYPRIMVVQIYVSKIEVSLGNSRRSGSRVTTQNGTAKYTVDNSSVPSGRVTINGTEYPISSGSFSFDLEPTVGKWTYKVDSATDGIGCDTIESNTLVYMIYDRIKIVEGGVTNNSTNVGETVKVWFRAVYEYDGEPFDGNKGKLYVGGLDWWVTMDWSPTDNRWEHRYTGVFPGTETFEVVRVLDDQYGITVINDQVGPQSISFTQPLATILWRVTLVCIIVAAITLLLIVIRRKRAHKEISATKNLETLPIKHHSLSRSLFQNNIS